MTIEASLMKKRPKDHVRPSRHNRAKAPITQDLADAIQRQTHRRKTNDSFMSLTCGRRENKKAENLQTAWKEIANDSHAVQANRGLHLLLFKETT